MKPNYNGESYYSYCSPRFLIFIVIAVVILTILSLLRFEPVGHSLERSIITGRDEFQNHEENERNEEKVKMIRDDLHYQHHHQSDEEKEQNRKRKLHLKKGGNPDDIDG